MAYVNSEIPEEMDELDEILEKTNPPYPIPYHKEWDIIDSSKLNDFILCQRMYFYRHLLGWRAESTRNDLKFGEAIHKAQEHLLRYGYDQIAPAYDAFLECYREEFPESTDELFATKTPARALLALIAYTKYYPHDLDEYEVLHTEISGTVPISNKNILHFRMDDILRERSTNRYGSFEHKTKGGGIYDSYANQWPMSVQVGAYHHALYCLYGEDDVFGVKINTMGFLKTKFDFRRFPFKLSKKQMQVWMNMVGYYFDQLEAEMKILADERPSDSTLLAFQPCPSSCDKWFGCPYLDFCTCWPNPLQRCDEVPMGYVEEFWNPMNMDATEKMEFKQGE